MATEVKDLKAEAKSVLADFLRVFDTHGKGSAVIDAILQNDILAAYFVDRRVNAPGASLILWHAENPEEPYFDIESACDGILHHNGEKSGIFKMDRALNVPSVWIEAHVDARDCWEWTEHPSEQAAHAALNKANPSPA